MIIRSLSKKKSTNWISRNSI